jgi:hypothetical protein
MAGELTTTQNFANGDQVTSAKLNAIVAGASFTASAVTGTTLAVVGGKLKVGTITASEIDASAVGTTALAANGVTTAKIADGNITTAKLATGAVTATKITDGVITFAHLSSAVPASESAMVAESSDRVVTPDVVKYSSRVAKAHGCIQLTASTRTLLSSSVNITSVAPDTTTGTEVVIAANMASENYTVLATWEASTGSDLQTVSIYNKTQFGFYIKHPTASSGKRINFVVFGLH